MDLFSPSEYTDSTYPKPNDAYPLHKRPNNETKPETTTASTGGDERPLILIVEDNTDIVTYISESLSDDYRIVAVANGAEGISQASRIFPDMIISDIMMPKLDGISMVKALKENPKPNTYR